MTAPAIEPIDALRRRQFIRLTTGSLATLAGCTPRDANRRDRTLIIAFPGTDKGMNPLNDEESKFLVFLPLLRGDDSGELEGRLAERWEHSADYREWTYHLRKNVRWHDGVPVTAHDVKFTLELLTHPDILELGPHDIESVSVLDDSTVRVRFGSLYGWHSMASWEVIFPKHLLNQLDPKKVGEWDFWTHPIGNGPYRFVHGVPHTMMEFEANPDYYRGKPRIERLVLKFARGAGLVELFSGNVDVFMDETIMGGSVLPSTLAASVHAYYGFRPTGIMYQYAILWQNAHPLFKDVRVRRALTLAINRRELARIINLPEILPIVDGPLTPRQMRRGELPAPLPYDPDQARALFDAAGWRQPGASAVRERDGRSFRFTMLQSTRPGFSQIAVYVQAALRNVGVGMDIQTMDESLVSPAMRGGQFDAALVFGTADDWFQTRFPLGLGYRNPHVGTLVKEIDVAMTQDDIDRICRELAEIFRVDVPATFLFPSVGTVLAHQRVHGLSSPWRADPIRHIDELWLDDRGS